MDEFIIDLMDLCCVVIVFGSFLVIVGFIADSWDRYKERVKNGKGNSIVKK